MSKKMKKQQLILVAYLKVTQKYTSMILEIIISQKRELKARESKIIVQVTISCL